MPFVISLDPGGSTGIAIYDVELDAINSYEISSEDHHTELYKLFYTLRPTAIICERFDYRNTSKTGVVIVSREYIGVAKLYAQLTDTPIFLQSASQAKGFVADINLQMCEVRKSGQPHANDAVRHMLYFLINNRTVDDKISKKWLAKGWKF